ncbi:MAG TPA: insulinase family protein [Caulobacteraceae bacterium]|jgi:zinc protease
MSYRKITLGLAAAGALLTAAALQPVAWAALPERNATFAHERSDLKPDPAARFGKLPNGMRYVIYKNATPPGEVAMRFRFDAGDLMETDAQNGLAHFLEHMAFNGTTNIPEGELNKMLAREGIAFGADSNAGTWPDQTVYELNIPGVNDKRLDVAFTFMRELASEIAFDPKAIDRERGIIVSEDRSQYTPARRAGVAEAQFVYKGQLVARRMDIGNLDVIRTAPRERFVDYYNRYYRPERATLIVVGDIDPDKIEADIRRRFSDWRGKGEAGAEPDLGTVARRGFEAGSFVMPGALQSASLNWLRPYEEKPDNRANSIQDVRESLALMVLNRRFARLVEAGEAPFTGAGAATYDFLRSGEQTEVSVTPLPGRHADSIKVAEQEVRRLVQHGVLQSELDREIANVRTALQRQVAGAATRRTPAIADQIVDAVRDDDVFMAPDQQLPVFEEAVRGFTAAEATRLAREQFQGSGPLLFATSPTVIAGGDAALAAAYTGSTQVAVAAPAEVIAKPWPYQAFGQAGQVVSRQDIADLGVTRVTFANGTVLLVKPTDFRKDQVLVSARFAGGRMALPKDLVTWPATQGGFIAGGLQALTEEELKQTLTGKVYGSGFSIGDDAFILSGTTRPEDLATQMQVLAAYATAPGWRAAPYERTKANLQNIYNVIETTPLNIAFTQHSKLVRSGDGRWGLPTREELAAARVDPVRAVLEPAFRSAPLEVVMVGDVTVDQAIQHTASTFAALPKRAASGPRLPGADRIAFTKTSAPVRLTHTGRPDVALGMTAWATDDFYDDTQEARTMSVLRAVLQLRTIEKLREELGSTYSPAILQEASDKFDEWGLVGMLAEVNPSQTDTLIKAMNEVADELKKTPITQDELDRAVKPILDTLAKDRAGNEYWAGRLATASWDAKRLDATRRQEAELRAVTPAAIQRVAQKYLRPERSFTLRVEPAAPMPASGAPATTTPASKVQTVIRQGS